MLVSISRATTDAPGMTAPCGSTTRPLTLAVLTVSCAAAGIAGAIRHHARHSPHKRDLIELLLHWQPGRAASQNAKRELARGAAEVARRGPTDGRAERTRDRRRDLRPRTGSRNGCAAAACRRRRARTARRAARRTSSGTANCRARARPPASDDVDTDPAD